MTKSCHESFEKPKVEGFAHFKTRSIFMSPPPTIQFDNSSYDKISTTVSRSIFRSEA